MNEHLSLDDKLAALKATDVYRKWYSLDDRRFCILCEKIFDGRMIDVRLDSNGSYWLNCPTPGCAGSPRDWFFDSDRRSTRSAAIASSSRILSGDFPNATLA